MTDTEPVLQRAKALEKLLNEKGITFDNYETFRLPEGYTGRYNPGIVAIVMVGAILYPEVENIHTVPENELITQFDQLIGWLQQMELVASEDQRGLAIKAIEELKKLVESNSPLLDQSDLRIQLANVLLQSIGESNNLNPETADSALGILSRQPGYVRIIVLGAFAKNAEIPKIHTNEDMSIDDMGFLAVRANAMALTWLLTQ